MRLYNLFRNSIKNLNADYIIEQGTSGIWTYRKWASGLAECWGTTDAINVSASATIVQDISLPITFSESNYYIQMSESGNHRATYLNFHEYIHIEAYSYTTTGFVFRLYNSTTNAVNGIAYHFYIMGRWKPAIAPAIAGIAIAGESIVGTEE